jgi:hypothetical protein
MKRGKCELCHRIRDLHDSHYLPKAGYKSAREGSLANPNPIVLAGGKARHSSVQIRGYKFCTECEGRLNKGGEAWVLKVTPKTYGGKFAIHEMIRDAPVIHMREGFVLLESTKIPTIDMEKLIYFAMSIFWRGTLKWSDVQGGKIPTVTLNIRQKDAMRLFLLGCNSFPRDAVLRIAIWPFEKVPPMICPSSFASDSTVKMFSFYFSGFIFSLATGKNIPDPIKRVDAYRKRVLIISRDLGQKTWGRYQAADRKCGQLVDREDSSRDSRR